MYIKTNTTHPLCNLLFFSKREKLVSVVDSRTDSLSQVLDPHSL